MSVLDHIVLPLDHGVWGLRGQTDIQIFFNIMASNVLKFEDKIYPAKFGRNWILKSQVFPKT